MSNGLSSKREGLQQQNRESLNLKEREREKVSFCVRETEYDLGRDGEMIESGELVMISKFSKERKHFR